MGNIGICTTCDMVPRTVYTKAIPDDIEYYGYETYVNQFIHLNYSDMNKLKTTKMETIDWLKKFDPSGKISCINRIINNINDNRSTITKKKLIHWKETRVLEFEFTFYFSSIKSSLSESFCLIGK